MSVRDGMQWRRRAGKVCVVFLATLCLSFGVHIIRLYTVNSLQPPYDLWLFLLETIAIWLMLIAATLLLLIVAVELSIVAVRLLRQKHRN